ncbi:MAG: hypothetical protein JNL64_02670 [Blastocatellia bacterium]|nr:hypothetical protein [Blastocatellia bacterium]
MTKVGKNYDEYGKVIRTTSSIFASLLPKGFYTIYETEENGKSTRIETIKIADVMYKRHDNGSWKLLGKRLEENVGIIPSSLSYAKTSKERVTVDGVSLWLYQAIIQSVPSRGNPDDKLAVWSLQCWIDMKGRMTRTIQQSRPPLSSEFREDVYEYDPKDLKIEAPIK